jgi:hypothetical protein
MRPTLSPTTKLSAPTEKFGNSDHTVYSDNVESKQPEKFPQQKLLPQLLANGKPSQLSRSHRATLRGLSSAHYAPGFRVCQAVSKVNAAFFTPSSQCAKHLFSAAKTTIRGPHGGRDSRPAECCDGECQQPTGRQWIRANPGEFAGFWARSAGWRRVSRAGRRVGQRLVASFRPVAVFRTVSPGRGPGAMGFATLFCSSATFGNAL